MSEDEGLVAILPAVTVVTWNESYNIGWRSLAAASWTEHCNTSSIASVTQCWDCNTFSGIPHQHFLYSDWPLYL